MIDLTPMKSIVVDARTSGGVRRRHDVRERDAATQEHALAVPGGFVSTGVAGLTLGGGFGWLTRLAGLSSDNLIAAEVVTADGHAQEQKRRGGHPPGVTLRERGSCSGPSSSCPDEASAAHEPADTRLGLFSGRKIPSGRARSALVACGCNRA
jgi:FAD/FMN-containing dehydrogenase